MLDRAAVVSGCQVKSEVHQDNSDTHARIRVPLSYVCPTEVLSYFMHTVLPLVTAYNRIENRSKGIK